MEYRLKRRKDFDLVFNKGKRAYTKSVAMYYFVKQSSCGAKIGISVSKKHGKAVVRNRIKRLMRASYIPLLSKIKGNVFIVFVPRVADDYTFSELNKSVCFLLKKENLLN